MKSRTLAAELVERGRLRINRRKVNKAAALIWPGDVLTFYYGGRVHTVKVTGCAERRGPAVEARALYVDLDVHALDCREQSTHGDQNGGA